MKRVLAATVLLALPLAAVAAPAHAAESATVLQLPSSVSLTDPAGIENDRLSVTVSYECANDPAQPYRSWYLYGSLTREGMNTFYFGTRYVSYVQATCTGKPVTDVLSFKRDPRDTESPGRYLAGPADLTVGLFYANGAPEQGGPQVSKTAESTVVLPAPPPPVKESVTLTANATPEPVTVGKTLTVKGTLKRAGKGYAATTSLQFRTPTGSYANVNSVTSNAAGKLSTKVTAKRDGCYRYFFVGDDGTQSGASAGDCVDVVPKPKD